MGKAAGGADADAPPAEAQHTKRRKGLAGAPIPTAAAAAADSCAKQPRRKAAAGSNPASRTRAADQKETGAQAAPKNNRAKKPAPAAAGPGKKNASRQVATAAAAAPAAEHSQQQAGKKAAASRAKKPKAASAADADGGIAAAAAYTAAQLKASEELEKRLEEMHKAAAGPSGTGNIAAACAAAAAAAEPAASAAAAPPAKPSHRELSKPDPCVDAAVEAAGLAFLKSRPGRIYCGDQKLELADVSMYRLGDQTGHHAKLYVWEPESDAPASSDTAAARAAGPPDEDKRWVQVSTSCHDCQYQHIKWLCPQRQHSVKKQLNGLTWPTYCSRCLVYRFSGTQLSLADLHKSCPQCRGCCTCKACLGRAKHEGQVEVEVADSEQQRRDGAYLQQKLGPHVGDWLQRQTAEAQAAGYADLRHVPPAALAERDKVFCDRCATNLIGLSATCPDCGAEVCADCMRELRAHEQPAPQQQQHGEEPQQHCASGGMLLSWLSLGRSHNIGAPAAGSNGPAAGSSGGGQAGSGSFAWHCCNPKCGQEEQPAAAEPDMQQDGQQPPDQQQQQQQQQQPKARMSGGQCWCRADRPQLQLQMVLPGDLFPVGQTEAEGLQGVLEQLRQVAQAPARSLCIQDCPLLPQAVLPLLPLTDGGGQSLTLQQLESDDWWRCLQQPYRDSWRRHAGRQGVDKWLYTPGFEDLQVPAPLQHTSSKSSRAQAQQREYEQRLRVCGLALALFWARWRQGEPVIVKSCKGRIPWDPHTMWRATKDVQAQQTGRVVAQDCCDFHELPPEAINAAKFFAGYSSGIWQQHGRLVAGPLPKDSVAVLPEAAKTQPAAAAATAAAKGAAAARAAPAAAPAGAVTANEAAAGGSSGAAGAPGAAAAAGGSSGSAGSAGSAGSGGSAGRGSAGAAGASGAVRGAFVGPQMLKVKDWPPTDDFGGEMPRHFMDFVERMPVRSITNPRLGWATQNLASMLLHSDNPTDLGPKCYLAYGRQQEAFSEGDSVTKLHKDMTDAINILVEQQAGGDPASRQLLLQQQQQGGATAGAAGASGEEPAAVVAEAPGAVRCGDATADKPGYGGAGAVWDIYARGSDTDQLSGWLAGHAADFTHQGKPVSVQFSGSDVSSHAPVMSQKLMLTEPHREQLFNDTGVCAWHFEQYLEEGVFIPGGCPHQVRNLMSCSKVAVDFVSPEAVESALQQHGHLRAMDLARGNVLADAPQDRDTAEKLQSHLLLLRGALTAYNMTAEPQVRLRPQEKDVLQDKLKPSKRKPAGGSSSKAVAGAGGQEAGAAAGSGAGSGAGKGRKSKGQAAAGEDGQQQAGGRAAAAAAAEGKTAQGRPRKAAVAAAAAAAAAAVDGSGEEREGGLEAGGQQGRGRKAGARTPTAELLQNVGRQQPSAGSRTEQLCGRVCL